jgi:hypothetical protein
MFVGCSVRLYVNAQELEGFMQMHKLGFSLLMHFFGCEKYIKLQHLFWSLADGQKMD